mgnify:CR=1 FL=1
MARRRARARDRARQLERVLDEVLRVQDHHHPAGAQDGRAGHVAHALEQAAQRLVHDLDLALDVVHKHRIGACQGRLVANPQGLRYETTIKDDAFTTPLGSLEVFEVDYKEKILRVKLPKGRRLDFTDPGGNADKLFVFHRDVDKARQRLAKGDAVPSQP